MVVITPDETAYGEGGASTPPAVPGPEDSEQLRQNLRSRYADDRSHDMATAIVAGYLDRGRPFSLYLRNFAVEAHKVVKPPTAADPRTRYWSYFGGRSTVENRLGDAFAPAIRMIGVANPADPMEMGLRFPRLDVVAPDWERVVGWLIDGASLIVLDLDTLAPGVSAELALIADHRRTDDTVVILPSADGSSSRENPLVQGLLRDMGGAIRSDPTPTRDDPLLAGFPRVATEAEIEFDHLAHDPHFADLLARHERELGRSKDRAALSRRARFLTTYGLWDHGVGKPGKALETYAKAQKLFVKADDALGYAELLMHMGRAGLDLQMYDQAIGVFKRSGTIAAKYGNPAGYTAAVAWVGLAYYLDGKSSVAVQILMKALELDAAAGRSEISVDALKTLARIYADEGDRASAANVAADLETVRRELDARARRPTARRGR